MAFKQKNVGSRYYTQDENKSTVPEIKEFLNILKY